MGSYAAAGSFNVRKIAIIGAGPCGLSAAKYLLARKCFESIVIFEQRDRVGGVWNYGREPSSAHCVPQTDPFPPPDTPSTPKDDGGGGSSTRAAPLFPSPMYETLHANIPGSLMRYKDRPFPEDARLFPSREVIREYIDGYADEVRHLIKFCYQVERIDLVQQQQQQLLRQDRWDVQASSTIGGQPFRDTFDAVVVANGHYSVPFVPDIKGIRAFDEAHPGVISHSKNYRTPQDLAGKKVVVVGNGPSGLDIARQIRPEARETLLSARSATEAEKLSHVGATEVSEIDEFLPLNGEKSLKLKDGTTVEGVDAVLFCTGFLFSYPFLPTLAPELLGSVRGKAVRGLYKHIFLIGHPTLAFPGLMMKAVPFPLSEVQAAVVAGVWANALALPAAGEMEAWEEALRRERGEAMHTFPTHGDDAGYINEMHDWAMTAEPRGREPPFWDEEMRWVRSIFAAAKLRFERQGCVARSLEELGFVFPGEKRPGEKHLGEREG